MVIQVDTREKARAIAGILRHFEKENIRVLSSKLPVGDYMSLDNARLVIDRKQNLAELCGNVCQQHSRFKRELQTAQDCEIKLVILCEHGGQIKSLEDVRKWKNPRSAISPLAMSGERLYAVLLTMGKRYNIDYVFCDKRCTGKEIVRILQDGQ